MKIKNKTAVRQEVQITDLLRGGRVCTITIGPNTLIELDPYMIATQNDNIEIIEDRISETPKETAPVVEEVIPVVEEVPAVEEVKEEETQVEVPVVEKTPDRILCEKCGAEFASMRGLKSHMSRAHSVK